MIWSIVLSILAVLFALGSVAGAALVVYTFGAYPRLPAINWFAVLMVGFNIGAAVIAWRDGSLNTTIYSLAAAVLNMSVYFNFDQLLYWIRRWV